MSTITIDGQAIEFTPGATVLETALANSIDIPPLCYHPDLQPSGGCRLCTVEVEGRGAPAASCGLAAEEGMVIHTRSDQLTAYRAAVFPCSFSCSFSCSGFGVVHQRIASDTRTSSS